MNAPDGLLVIDKPGGPTSHDVVARVRRTLRQKRIGHTGTLDPMASGVLLLVIGRATRLARFLSSAPKAYSATVRLGVETDTYDATGVEQSRHDGPLPDRALVEQALEAFRGTIRQRPPAYSAKKVGGERSHHLARRAAGSHSAIEPLEAVDVSVKRLALTDFDHGVVELDLECSAGFYVRSLAHDLGKHLGVGGHLAALRRTRSGTWTLADAVALHVVDGFPDRAVEALIPLRDMLPEFPAMHLRADGVGLARRGVLLGPEAVQSEWTLATIAGHQIPGGAGTPVRLIGPDGDLVGLGRTTKDGRHVHPFIVLASDLM